MNTSNTYYIESELIRKINHILKREEYRYAGVIEDLQEHVARYQMEEEKYPRMISEFNNKFIYDGVKKIVSLYNTRNLPTMPQMKTTKIENGNLIPELNDN